MIEILESALYKSWFKRLNRSVQGRVQSRVDRIEFGNFGDHKSVGDGVWELRLKFGGGIRIYYTFNGTQLVLLLAGGNKATQVLDIATAKRIAKDRGGDKWSLRSGM